MLHLSVGGIGGSADCCKKQSPPNVQYSAQLLPETKLLKYIGFVLKQSVGRLLACNTLCTARSEDEAQ